MARHKVPTFLDQPDGIGRFSMRQIVMVGAPLLYVLPRVWTVLPTDGPALGDLVRTLNPQLAFLFGAGSVPVVPLLGTAIVWTPFLLAALPLDPPFEHGVSAAARWAFRERGDRSPERVAKDLGELVVVNDRVESNYGFHAVWKMPTENLRLADPSEVERIEDQWGEFATGLTTTVQTIVRAARVDPEPMVSRIEQYTPPKRSFAATGKRGQQFPHATPQSNAQTLGAALRTWIEGRELIERRHELAVFAADEQALADSVDEITDAIGSLGFKLARAGVETNEPNVVRRLAGDELRASVQSTFSTQPPNKRLGPVGRTFNAMDAWFADNQWHLVLALGNWPRIMPDNAFAPLVDGRYEVDVIQFITPLEAADIQAPLERKLESHRVTNLLGQSFVKRSLAITDIEDFLPKLTGGEESAFDVAVYLHVHGATKRGVERDAKRIAKRIKRAGASTKSLVWEQAAAMRAIAPLGVDHLERRTKRVDTSSLTNTFPYVASSMWMDGAVPLGETPDSLRAVGLNYWLQPLISNPHLIVYAFSGGGKGFFLKVLESRSLFARLTQEIFAFDQATEDPEFGEYGRWADYCGMEYRHVRARDDFKAALADMDNYRWLGPGICWNIAQLPFQYRPEFVAEVKRLVWDRARKVRANRRLLVDELWNIVKLSSDMECDPHWLAMCFAALDDLVRTGRHMHVGFSGATQAVKDSLEVPVMQVIQQQCAIQAFGKQQQGDISDIAPRLHWTPAEVRAIKKFNAGDMLLAAGPWRVAFHVAHVSDEEYAMANTDNIVQLEAVA